MVWCFVFFFFLNVMYVVVGTWSRRWATLIAFAFDLLGNFQYFDVSDQATSVLLWPRFFLRFTGFNGTKAKNP